MLKLQVSINNLLHSIGLARWRMQIETVCVDGSNIQVGSIMVSDADRMARLKYPGDER